MSRAEQNIVHTMWSIALVGIISMASTVFFGVIKNVSEYHPDKGNMWGVTYRGEGVTDGKVIDMVKDADSPYLVLDVTNDEGKVITPEMDYPYKVVHPNMNSFYGTKIGDEVSYITTTERIGAKKWVAVPLLIGIICMGFRWSSIILLFGVFFYNVVAIKGFGAPGMISAGGHYVMAVGLALLFMKHYNYLRQCFMVCTHESGKQVSGRFIYFHQPDTDLYGHKPQWFKRIHLVRDRVMTEQDLIVAKLNGDA